MVQRTECVFAYRGPGLTPPNHCPEQLLNTNPKGALSSTKCPPKNKDKTEKWSQENYLYFVRKYCARRSTVWGEILCEEVLCGRSTVCTMFSTWFSWHHLLSPFSFLFHLIAHSLLHTVFFHYFLLHVSLLLLYLHWWLICHHQMLENLRTCPSLLSLYTLFFCAFSFNVYIYNINLIMEFWRLVHTQQSQFSLWDSFINFLHEPLHFPLSW